MKVTILAAAAALVIGTAANATAYTSEACAAFMNHANSAVQATAACSRLVHNRQTFSDVEVLALCEGAHKLSRIASADAMALDEAITAGSEEARLCKRDGAIYFTRVITALQFHVALNKRLLDKAEPVPAAFVAP